MATLLPEGIEALLATLGVAGPVPIIEGTDLLNNPIDIYLLYLADTLVKLTECSPRVAYESIQWPNELGDLVVVLPRLRLQTKNPKALAVELKQKFPGSHLMGHPVDDGIHLRFFFSAHILGQILLPYIIDRGRSYGIPINAGPPGSASANTEPKKKIVVEFSSPNLGKEFDGLHLRSTIIGAYIASLYESMGHQVTRMNFLGDWGQNIGLLAAGWSRFGSEDALKADPLRHLLDVYTQIDELSKNEQANSQELPTDGQLSGIAAERDANVTALDNADSDAIALWKRFRELSIQSYTNLYARMGIRFDEYSGESEVNHDTITEVESSLQDKIVFDEARGGYIIDFSVHETRILKTGHAKIRNLRGLTTYLLRDVAAALDRSRKYDFDELKYVVSAKQDSHFQQLFAILELMGQAQLADRLQHISFNTARGLAPEEGASGLLLGDILDKCHTMVSCLLADDPDRFSHFQDSNNPTVCDNLGALALMTQDLAIRRKDDLIFDIPNIGIIEEDTGLDLQSCITKLGLRLQGIVIDRKDLEKSDYSLVEDERYAEILRILIQFPVIIKTSLEKLDSSPILTYMFRLIAQVDDILDEEGEPEASTSSHNLVKLGVYQAVRQVLENGMRVVGLTPIETPSSQEHSGIVPIELPLEVTTEDVKTAADVDDTQIDSTAYTVSVEITADALTGSSDFPEAVITDAVLDPTEPIEGVVTEAVPDPTDPTEQVNIGTIVELVEDPTPVVVPDSAADVAETTATDPISEAIGNLQIIEGQETSPTEALGSGDEPPTPSAEATDDPETLTAPANDAPNTSGDVKHDEASDPPVNAHNDPDPPPTASVEEQQHLELRGQILASIEAH